MQDSVKEIGKGDTMKEERSCDRKRRGIIGKKEKRRGELQGDGRTG